MRSPWSAAVYTAAFLAAKHGFAALRREPVFVRLTPNYAVAKHGSRASVFASLRRDMPKGGFAAMKRGIQPAPRVAGEARPGPSILSITSTPVDPVEWKNLKDRRLRLRVYGN